MLVTEGTNDPDFIGWSPDDKRIAIAQDKPSRGDFGSQITMFDFSSGQSKLFQSFDDMVILSFLWDPDGRNIFVVFAAIGGQPFTVNYPLGSIFLSGSKIPYSHERCR